MQPDTLYVFANYGVLPFWLLLALLPHHRITRALVHSGFVPLLLGALYIWGFATARPAQDADALTLTGAMSLLQDRHMMLAAWVHYLIFDLFVGAWQVRDARRRGVPHWLVVPGLFATLMAGPVGLLWYLVVRFVRDRSWRLDER